MSTSFTQVFGGTTIYPSDVSYLPLALTSDISLEWPLEATTGNNVVARIIDITPTGPYTVTLPDAMSVGVGQTILFNNLGPDTITIDNAAGNAILSIGAGEQWQCYLISNTTIGGVWRTFRYGAAVAQEGLCLERRPRHDEPAYRCRRWRRLVRASPQRRSGRSHH
jgi:hypothetical protein